MSEASEGREATLGSSFYDDEIVFSNYAAHRDWGANPNVVMEEPAMLGAIGDVTGARVLDLGCGDAAIGRMLLEAEYQRRRRIPLFLLLAGEKV